MIVFDQVSKIFAGREGPVAALANVSLRIEQGEFVAVRGPSGSGKSTLLNLAGGMAAPTSGVVEVAGQNLVALTPAQRTRFRGQTIGMVFQLFHLLPYLDALQNVLVAASSQTPDPQGRALVLLTQFQLADRLRHRPDQLSVGERQRVALARALLNMPALLLADEPTGNLDADSGRFVLDALEDFHRQGGTVLLATHDATAAARAQRVLFLERGNLVPTPRPAAPRPS